MRVDLILPLEALHGKLTSDARYYFRTVNGRQYVQRCPRRTQHQSASQKASRDTFIARSRLVAQWQRNGSRLSPKRLWAIAAELLPS